MKLHRNYHYTTCERRIPSPPSFVSEKKRGEYDFFSPQIFWKEFLSLELYSLEFLFFHENMRVKVLVL